MSGGITVTVTLVLLRLLVGRLERREAHIDGATQRLIEGLEAQVTAMSVRLTEAVKRIDSVEGQLRDCERKHSESEAEVMRLKAQMTGFGEARDRAQVIIAAEKRKEAGG